MRFDWNLADGFAKGSPEARRNLEMFLANGGKLRFNCDAEFVVSAKKQGFMARPAMRGELQKMEASRSVSKGLPVVLTYAMFCDTGSEGDGGSSGRVDGEHSRW